MQVASVVNAAEMSLREAVKAEATERTWSQGVTLAREQRVVGRGRSGDELELKVHMPGRPTPFEVVLDLGNDEWQCDCPSKEAVCSHVVAAVLATEKAREGGAPDALPTSSKAGAPIRYLLEPDPGGVRVDRVLVRGDNDEPLPGPLMSLVGQGKAGGSEIRQSRRRCVSEAAEEGTRNGRSGTGS